MFSLFTLKSGSSDSDRGLNRGQAGWWGNSRSRGYVVPFMAAEEYVLKLCVQFPLFCCAVETISSRDPGFDEKLVVTT